MTDEHSPDSSAFGITLTDERSTLRHQRTTDDAQTQQFVIDAARMASDMHCTDVLIFDVRGLSEVTDYILIASGTSDKQIQSVSRDVSELAEQYDLPCFGSEIDAPSTWAVADFVDAIVHLFDPATRAHYDLEMMWGDAPRIQWQRDAQQ